MSVGEHQNKELADINGVLHLWKDECVFKWVIYVEGMWNYFWIWSFL